jgi:hypothetical protein
MRFTYYFSVCDIKNNKIRGYNIGNYEDFCLWDVTPCGLVCNNGLEESNVSIFRVEDLTLFYQNVGTYCKIMQHEILDIHDLYA